MFALIVIIAIGTLAAIAAVMVIECRANSRAIDRANDAQARVAGMAAKARQK